MTPHALCKRCRLTKEEQEWDGYHIPTALEILKAAPRLVSRLCAEEVVRDCLEESVIKTKAHIEHVDARRPCIAVHYGRKRFMIIDGNHRAAKQLRYGRKIRAYVLTPQEAKKARGD
jgi:hypothetical protein